MDFGQNKQGNVAELKFQLRAWELDLIVSKPCGEKGQYDFIVDSKGKLSKVQVKSTKALKYKRNKKPSGYRAQLSRIGKYTRNPFYTKEQIDFFAIYIIPKDAWYIIPLETVKNKQTIQLYPDNPNTKYVRYKEAWELFK